MTTVLKRPDSLINLQLTEEEYELLEEIVSSHQDEGASDKLIALRQKILMRLILEDIKTDEGKI